MSTKTLVTWLWLRMKEKEKREMALDRERRIAELREDLLKGDSTYRRDVRCALDSLITERNQAEELDAHTPTMYLAATHLRRVGMDDAADEIEAYAKGMSGEEKKGGKDGR